MNEPPEEKEKEPQDHAESAADHQVGQLGQFGQLSEAELEAALSTLEHILRHRHVVPESRDLEAGGAVQETLPLLKNVVIPGDPPTPIDLDGPDDDDFDLDEALEPAPPHDDLVVRLVNELDIIIESCVDSALAEAKQELMVQMKNHLDIVLPEILDELERRRYEPDEDDDKGGD